MFMRVREKRMKSGREIDNLSETISQEVSETQKQERREERVKESTLVTLIRGFGAN